MTEYELKGPGQFLSSLMNDKNALAELLDEILNQVLEVQAEDQLGAGLKRIFAAETATDARRRMKSTNMQERLIQKVRRRERVIRISPNEASALPLSGFTTSAKQP